MRSRWLAGARVKGERRRVFRKIDEEKEKRSDSYGGKGKGARRGEENPASEPTWKTNVSDDNMTALATGKTPRDGKRRVAEECRRNTTESLR